MLNNKPLFSEIAENTALEILLLIYETFKTIQHIYEHRMMVFTIRLIQQIESSQNANIHNFPYIYIYTRNEVYVLNNAI